MPNYSEIHKKIPTGSNGYKTCNKNTLVILVSTFQYIGIDAYINYIGKLWEYWTYSNRLDTAKNYAEKYSLIYKKTFLVIPNSSTNPEYWYVYEEVEQ